MCASRAAFSRSILAIATTLSTGLATRAMAQGFAPGLHLVPTPDSRAWNLLPELAEDGTAVGVNLSSQTTGNFGAVYRPGGLEVFADASRVYDISDNGAYTVGFVTRRSASGVVDTLIPNTTQPVESEVRTSISGDGSVVAGTFENSSFSFQAAFRWTEQGGLQYLGGYRAGAAYTRVFDVSRDGSMIVGEGRAPGSGYGEAWTWTEQTGFRILPELPNAPLGSARATAANADGSIIVGRTQDPVFGFRGIVWRDNQIIALPTVPGWRSAEATDLSDDGTIILGTLSASLVGRPETAAIWTQDTNWVPVLDFFRMRGVDIPSYLASSAAFEVSGDGRTFSGYVRDTRTSERFLSVIVIPCPSALGPLSLLWIASRRVRGRSRTP